MPNNFPKAIPDIKQSMKTISMFKDEYLLDFINTENLGLEIEDIDERVVEQEIVRNMRDFILQFGKDFIFMGNQYRDDYVSKIGYDKFEQRTYLKYCNGAETFYTYDPQRRRLQNLTVNSGGNTIMDNAYTYDAVSNVLSVVNGASVPQSGKAGGQMAHTYTYDALYRLVSATGTYTGADNKTASYTLAMGYDNMHRITSKRQILTQNNVQFDGSLNAGYDLTYTYGTDAGKKFQLANVKDVNYRTEETPSESEIVNLLERALLPIKNRYGENQDVIISMASVCQHKKDIMVLYPYGGTDFGSFMLFVV